MKGFSLSSVTYLLRHLRPYRGRMIAAILSGILKEASIIGAAGICAWMVAAVAAGRSFPDRRWLFILLAVVLVRAVSSHMESVLNHDVSYHILVDFRVKLYRAFSGSCPDILLHTRSGQISTTLMNDVEILEWFYAHTVGIFIVDAVLFLVLTIFMGWLHPSLAILLIAAVAVILFVPFLLKRQADEQGRESRHQLGEANAVTLEGINGLNEILTLNYREAYIRKNRQFMDALTKIQVSYAKRMGTEGGLLQIVSGFAAVCINLCGVYLVLNGSLEISWFAVVGTTVWLMFSPLLELAGMARNFGVIFAAADRIGGILEAEPIVRDTGTRTEAPAATDVEFDHVCYRYSGTEQDVLTDVCFRAGQGTMLALVGESGAGKTTCSHLLTRMWDVGAGAIRIGGVDIREMPLSMLHDLVTLVPQDVYLFNISMKENIRLGKPEASDEEVVRAAKMARIHDFIESLPQGYDTAAGERGLQMSGGQRQRVAIARALLMDSPILILDEAVSSLDTKTDLLIQQTIRSLASKKTVILVAHRLSTIQDADCLVVMKNGRVEEMGTHRELLQKDGYYRELVQAQLEEEAEQVTC